MVKKPNIKRRGQGVVVGASTWTNEGKAERITLPSSNAVGRAGAAAARPSTRGSRQIKHTVRGRVAPFKK